MIGIISSNTAEGKNDPREKGWVTGFMNKKSLHLGVTAALFGALIFVVTAYILHIPTPATGGYIHLGDAFVYLAASMLPAPYAVAAAGIGEALSDALTGSLVYALPTLLIKSLMALCFSTAGAKLLTKRNVAATFVAGAVCVGGYYLTEAALLHSFASPLVEIVPNLVQAGASAAIYLLLARALDRIRMKDRVAAFVH
jgi:uncharacterized repeat protein (TIGR04002 family)